MYLSNILDEPIYQPVKDDYEWWYNYMDQHIDFWLPESELHTKSHCARVLLLALLIADQKDLDEEEKEALAKAAIFHDSRRLDDGIDQGHGERAAKYYKEYCQNHDLGYDCRTYYAIYYHDQDDALGLSEIKETDQVYGCATIIYQIFKDADALDRFRLGPNALDANYLRTEEARALVDQAKVLLSKGR